MRWLHLLGLSFLLAGVACSQPSADTPSREEASPRPSSSPGAGRNAGDAWLRGDVDQRFALVAKHLRGFDMAMVETGHRYGELYWAGQDQNWGYADYQLQKIRTAIAHGVERRPRRAASARMIEGALDAMDTAIAARDAAAFASSFTTLTATCNACHQAEQVPFVQVRPPAQRLSPVYRAPTSRQEDPARSKEGE